MIYRIIREYPERVMWDSETIVGNFYYSCAKIMKLSYALGVFTWDCVIIRQETKKPNNSKGLRAVRNSLIRF